MALPNERAVKELGGDHRKVIQIDIKNGDKWDMVNGKVYEELLSMAIEGQISSVLTSPNCRTRSKLRHIQVPGMNLPGPARCWNGGEWGVPDGSAGEKRKCWEDDVMMFRSWMVYIVAQECSKAEGKKEDIDFVYIGASQSPGGHARSGVDLEDYFVGQAEESLQPERS